MGEKEAVEMDFFYKHPHFYQSELLALSQGISSEKQFFERSYRRIMRGSNEPMPEM